LWVFYFPQALRWYVENYGGGEGLAEETTWQSKLEFLRQHPNQLKLCLQGLILTVCVPYLLCGLLEKIGFRVDWSDLLFGVLIGLIFSVMAGKIAGLGIGMAFYMAVGVGVGVVTGVAFGVDAGMAFGLDGGVTVGAARGVVVGVILGMGVGVVAGVVAGVATGVVAGIGAGAMVGVFLGVGIGMATGVAAGVMFGMAIWHPENWLIGVQLNLISIRNRSFLLPRITPIPLPLLTTRLKFWLRKDWQLGLENIDQLLRYSLQFIPVVNAINQALAEIPPEQMIYRISQLAENPYDWKIVKYASASLVKELKLRFFEGLGLGAFSFMRVLLESTRFPILLSVPTCLETPPRAIAAGFWHLHEQEPEKATAAFEKVQSFLYGEEMFLLAQTVTQFQTAISPDAIAEIQIPNFPPEPHLRPTTWEALKGLRRVVEDTQLILKATSRPARAFALARAIGQLREIRDNADALPQAERGLIINITQTWQEALESIATNVGDKSITKPIENPYVIGDPVEGDLFVGREDTMRKLEELWVMSSQLQSVVLYGHRRMGKTSILRNFANCSGSDIQVV
ncbi:MAG: ATP-binding protein, partial [Okeania sp. SIO3C4]|nr:ATP-binding protein [Okeania sp. SIO3C4]